MEAVVEISEERGVVTTDGAAVEAEAAQKVETAKAAVEQAAAAAATVEIQDDDIETPPAAEASIPATETKSGDDDSAADTEKAPADDDSGWTDDLLADAAAFGYTDALAKTFKEPDVLRSHLDTLAASQAAEGRLLLAASTEEATTTADETKADETKAPAADAAMAKLVERLGQEEVDLLTTVLVAPVQQRLDVAERRLAKTDADADQQAKSAFMDQCDAVFKTATEHAAVFGDGAHRDGTLTKAQWDARDEAATIAASLAAARKARNQPVGTLASRLRFAIRHICREDIAKQTEAGIAKAAAKREKSIISRPSGKATKVPKFGKEAATRAVAKQMGVAYNEEYDAADINDLIVIT